MIALLPAVALAQEPAEITPDQAQAELMRRWRQAAPQGPCSANPRYLVVTVLSGTVYAEKRAPLDVQTGPYLLDLCEVIYMVHDKNGAKFTIHAAAQGGTTSHPIRFRSGSGGCRDHADLELDRRGIVVVVGDGIDVAGHRQNGGRRAGEGRALASNVSPAGRSGERL